MKEKVFWLVILSLIIGRSISSKPIYQEGDRIRLTGRVVTEPLRYSDAQRISMYGLRFYLKPYPEISYGDEIVVEGMVKGNQLVGVSLVSHQASKGYLYLLRNRIVNFYQKSLPIPHSALVSGMVIGSRQLILNDFWNKLKYSGTAHVVVASGMNVTFVASFLMALLILFVNRKKAVIISAIGVWMYTILSGFDAPIVRAAVMGSIAFSAQRLGRIYSAWRALFLSASIMLIIRPGWLIDLGFMLSFVATGSLMLFERKINRLIYFLPKIFREGLATSLAAQIGVAPILYYYFGQFNLLSPLINALVLWTVPLITIIGAFGGMVGLVVPVVGRLILYIAFPLTAYFIQIINLFG